jgi:hypothetical protein
LPNDFHAGIESPWIVSASKIPKPTPSIILRSGPFMAHSGPNETINYHLDFDVGWSVSLNGSNDSENG